MALAEASSHPLAQALVLGARAAGLRPETVADLTEVPGYGVEGTWHGRRVRLGRAGWCGAETDLGVTATWLCMGDDAPHAFTFTDSLRPGAAEAIAELRRQGKQIRLISGDTEGAVAALAATRARARWSMPSWRRATTGRAR